jgi:glutamyl-tRNA synthetase
MHKTRIAPTPSGFLHLGNVLSFIYTVALAYRNGADIVLRIDDLDQARVKKEYVQDIFDTLNYLEIPWNEGPRDWNEYQSQYSQVHRLDLYTAALQRLRESGNVFGCNCSRAVIKANSVNGGYAGTCRDKQIALDAKNVSWHLQTQEYLAICVHTPAGTVLADLPAAMSDFVVRRTDGLPAYQLTSVIDDEWFGVDLVVRGEDLWPSTLAQHALASALKTDALSNATFYHHPLLLDAGQQKLSKSAGATSVRYLRRAGKKPVDIYTEIAGRLGFAGEFKNWQEVAAVLGLNDFF